MIKLPIEIGKWKRNIKNKDRKAYEKEFKNMLKEIK